MSIVVLLLNVAGWGIFALAILPQHFHFTGLGLGLGVAFTAWTLGARHAFDADHISAIDSGIGTSSALPTTKWITRLVLGLHGQLR
jgi:high-affinity nickel permease